MQSNNKGGSYGVAPVEKDDKTVVEKNGLQSELFVKKASINDTALTSKKLFSTGHVCKDSSVIQSGAKSLTEFSAITKAQEKTNRLREQGLTDGEIVLRAKLQDGLIKEDQLGFLERGKLLNIQKKMADHQKALQAPVRFSDTVDLTRREMDALASETSGTKIGYLAQRKKNDLPSDHPLIETLREHEMKERETKLKRSYNIVEEKGIEVDEEDFQVTRKSPSSTKKYQYDQEEEEEEEDDDKDEDNCQSFIGPLHRPINERVVSLSEHVIYRNRIELAEILDMAKFKNYKAGTPSKVLYIKNLSKETTSEDLARLFSRYHVNGQSEVEYKLLQHGRMRGQAFVTFSDLENAVRGLNLCNGYKLHGKPMIIQYGRL